jgi:hypothetical protein
VRRAAAFCLIVGSLSIAAAASAGAPKLTATVKALSPTTHLVSIVNHDQIAYRNFIVQTVNKPRIIAASKPCAVQRDGNFVGSKFNWRYQARCTKTLAPGQTFKIRLTTSEGRGRIDVLVVVNGVYLRIGD